jgi:hypothetical protein
MFAPVLPDLSLFQQNGQWDPYASTLVEQLIRSHARSIRRHLHHPLPTIDDSKIEKAHLGICLHDIELLGEFGVPAPSEVSLELHLQRNGGEDVIKRISLGRSESMRWFIAHNNVMDMGMMPSETGTGVVVGTLFQDGMNLAKFRFNVDPSMEAASSQEHFLFGDTGEIVGRIALSEVRMDAQHPVEQNVYGQQQDPTTVIRAAHSLGHQLGQHLKELSTKK